MRIQNKLPHSAPKVLVDKNTGEAFASISALARALGKCRSTISESISANGYYKCNGRTFVYRQQEVKEETEEKTEEKTYTPEEIESFINWKSAEEVPFDVYDFSYREASIGRRYAVALFSDAHIEETVRPEAVLGLNEYNIDIAKKRIANYFNHLALCLNEDGVDTLIFASLGDTISGYIHEELSQTNGLSPLEAIYEAQSLIYNGLRYIREHTKVGRILFIGICGNHGRTTKKIQHSNGYRMSYEWLMYKNIEKECRLTGLDIEFTIPESEMDAVTAPDGRKFLFIHGFQIKSTGSGTVCGIYPALNRLTMKYDRTFHQDRLYLGHFHSCINIPNAVVNGSIIGYSAYSLSNGFSYEEPAQMYQLFDVDEGELLTRKIYCTEVR